MSYYIIAFKDKQDPKRIWVKTENTILKLVQEGYQIYRTGTDQYAIVILGDKEELVWRDAESE